MKNADIREKFLKLGKKVLDDVVMMHIFYKEEQNMPNSNLLDLLQLLYEEYSDELSDFEKHTIIYMITTYDKLLTIDEQFTLWASIPTNVVELWDSDDYYVEDSPFDDYMSDYDYDDGKYSIYDVYTPSELGIHVTYR